MKSIIGKVVTIAFLDHSQSSGVNSGPILCQVTGILTHATKEHLEITCWLIPGNKGENDHNEERFSILRSTIKEMFLFGKGRQIKRFK